MKRIKNYLLLCLFAFGCCLASCRDDAPESYAASGNQEMYLRVNVPRTYSAGRDADKETLIETLDVLVFAPGESGTSYYVRTASPGILLSGTNRFQVIMPVGENLIVHVFANCHDELESNGFYNCVGTEMKAMLASLPLAIDLNADATKALPMHGYLTDVDITKEHNDVTLPVSVLRSVAAVQVMTDVRSDIDGISLTPRPLDNFELRELYAFFQPQGGRVAAAAENYSPLAPGAPDVAREVINPSLPSAEAPVFPVTAPVFIKKAATATSIGNLYLYENKPWSLKGDDYVDAGHPAATTRMVVGGVYDNETLTDGTPRVSYYRVDFADPADASKLTSVLRNHKYTINIKSVGGPGYDTPEQAALGKPINIELELIDWNSEIGNADFDRENYFYAQTKSLLFPRTKNYVRTIDVESDVRVADWVMSFAGTDGRYKAQASSDGKRLTITVLKAYSELAPDASREETLLIKVKNLTVRIALNQADIAPDDWGTGGGSDTEL